MSKQDDIYTLLSITGFDKVAVPLTDIMMQAWELGHAEGYSEANQPYTDGIKDGYQDGYGDGFNAGYKQGRFKFEKGDTVYD